MVEPYKVEVRDPPQGVPPPHQQNAAKKSQGDQINRLRKFIAKPSAGRFCKNTVYRALRSKNSHNIKMIISKIILYSLT